MPDRLTDNQIEKKDDTDKKDGTDKKDDTDKKDNEKDNEKDDEKDDKKKDGTLEVSSCGSEKPSADSRNPSDSAGKPPKEPEDDMGYIQPIDQSSLEREVLRDHRRN